MSSLQQDREAIEKLAYQKWQEAGCPTGDGVEFWVQAEAEVAQPTTGTQAEAEDEDEDEE